MIPRKGKLGNIGIEIGVSNSKLSKSGGAVSLPGGSNTYGPGSTKEQFRQ